MICINCRRDQHAICQKNGNHCDCQHRIKSTNIQTDTSEDGSTQVNREQFHFPQHIDPQGNGSTEEKATEESEAHSGEIPKRTRRKHPTKSLKRKTN